MTDTNNKAIISADELLQSFGTSFPQGNAQINSVKVPRGSMGKLYCTGDAYIYGKVKTPLKLDKGIYFGDGSAQEPSISFESAPHTGLYKYDDNSVGISGNGVVGMVVSNNSVAISSELNTIDGDLVLNSASGVIDLSGNTLINIGGLSLTIGSPNQVIINDNVGNLTSEAYLSPIRGGTGQNSSASNGIARVTNGTWSFSPLADNDFSQVDTITVNQITVDTITSPGDININPTGDLRIESTVHQAATPISGGELQTFVVNTRSVDDSFIDLFVLPTTSGDRGTAYSVRALVALGDETGGVNTGSYIFILKCKNLLNVASVSTLIQQGSILDGTLTATRVSADVAGTNVRVRVAGLALTSIRWAGYFDVISQQF